jgi:hypothetical protein
MSMTPVTVKRTLTLALAAMTLIGASAAPLAASAQPMPPPPPQAPDGPPPPPPPPDGNYYDQCRRDQANRSVAGGLLGAVAGAVVGNNIGQGPGRAGGSIIGGVAGAGVGSQVGHLRRGRPAASAASPAAAGSLWSAAAPADASVRPRGEPHLLSGRHG